MGIGDWLLQLFGAIGAGSSLVSLVSTIHYLRRVPPGQRSSFIVGYGFVFFFLGLPGWIGVALLLSKLGAPGALTWSITLLVNVIVQPILLFGIVRGVSEVVRTLATGQLYFGWELILAEEEGPAEYAALRRWRLFQSSAATIVFAALSAGCFAPLL